MADKEQIGREISEAIGAHGVWKMRLKTAAQSGQILSADDICRDDRCQFGKWLHALPREVATTPNCTEAVRLHRAFHEQAGAIAHAVNDGRRDEALGLLEGEAYSAASAKLSMHLMAWKRAL